MTPRRFQAALACYALLAVLAGVTLRDNFRLVVIGVLLLFAFKSWLQIAKQKLDDADKPQTDIDDAAQSDGTK